MTDISAHTLQHPSASQEEVTKAALRAVTNNLPGLREVEELVASKLQSAAPLITSISEYLFSLGGKRMRPIVTLLTGQAFGLKPPSPALIEVAAGIELIHMATLLHDDIIDHSALRRHSPSPYARYGSTSTLLAGDFLLTRAFSLCAHLDRYIIDATEEACVHLTEGEILETPLFADDHDLASSAMIAQKKTAALFRLGARSAGYLAGLPVAAIDALALFGDKLGIAFQMLDDILDITSTEDLLGKQTGTDLRERKPSLINVLWLHSGAPLAQNLRNKPEGDDTAFISSAVAELRGSHVISEARSIAIEQALEARQALSNAAQIARQAGKTVNSELLVGLDAVITYTLNRMQ